MAVSRKLAVVLNSGFNDKGIKEARKSLQKLGGTINNVSNTALKAGAAFAVFQGARFLTDFARDAIEQSRDLERNMQGLATVFGSATPQMVDFVQEAKNLGLSQSEAAQATTFLGSVLKQSGFSIQETADLTERLVRLGTDLSITYGYDVQEALLGMTALFRGEYDPIEKFGVAMKQNEIESEKAARGLEGLTGAAERLADQQIRLEFLFDRSRDAQGAYQRQSESLFVAQQNLEATFKNMQAVAGQQLTPVFADLALAMTPIVDRLAPALAQIFERIIPTVVDFAENTDEVERVLNNLVAGVVNAVGFFSNLGNILANNIERFYELGRVIFQVGVTVKVIQGLTIAMNTLSIAASTTTRRFRILRVALISSGIGAAIVAVGFLAEKLFAAQLETDDLATKKLPKLNFQLGQTADKAAEAAEGLRLYEGGLRSIRAIEEGLEDFVYDPMAGFEETVTESTTPARDAVADFYSKMKDEVKKQEAQIKLENLGATSGLIDQILGAGEEWEKVFDRVIENGKQSVAEAQVLFEQTAAGLAEINARIEADNAELKEEYDRQKAIFDQAKAEFDSFKASALSARDGFTEFLSSMDALPTFEREMGKFERQVTNDFESLEQKAKDAFDNGYLLQESYNNLISYARSEYGALQQIARQRDQLLNRRNLADALLKDVRNATVSAGNITNILRNTQEETQQIDMTKVVQDTVQAGKNLKDFRVTIISDFVEPIQEAASKSDMLVEGFRGVVERTRTFVDNLKALRQLGLDPLLFNQLVQAGVEAGGETAQALVDGGSETVNEVNGLFRELDELGKELGENTAQVMYGEGENFVNGIIEGLDSQLGALEETARNLATVFVDTFTSILEAGIRKAIAAAKAAMPVEPTEPSYKPPSTGGGGGGSTNGGGGGSSSVADEVKKTTDAVKQSAKETKKLSDVVQKATSPATGVPGSIFDKAARDMQAKEIQKASNDLGRAANALAKEKTNIFPGFFGGGISTDMAAIGAISRGRTSPIIVNVTASDRAGGTKAGEAVAKELNYYAGRNGLSLGQLTR